MVTLPKVLFTLMVIGVSRLYFYLLGSKYLRVCRPGEFAALA